MLKTFGLLLLLTLLSGAVFSQSIDSPLSQKKMRKDLKIFRDIRKKANSGLYKYRTERETDSIYNWAEKQIGQSYTYRDFYNIICGLTDFEGSLHNDTRLSPKMLENLQKEEKGYFPFPLNRIDEKWIINFEKGEIPLGAEILAINDENIDSIINPLYKYYSTDGFNLTGKKIGIQKYFPEYYRFNYGLKDSFAVKYKERSSGTVKSATVKSIGYSAYYKNFRNRFSKPFDQPYYKYLKENEKYNFKKYDSATAILTIYTFLIGNQKSEEHKRYKAFLDSAFLKIKKDKIQNLIVDVRFNGGGTDPNDILTYSYLTARAFRENKQALISFKKIPFLRYYNINIPQFIRPLVVGKYNRALQKIFREEKEGKYYEGEAAEDHHIMQPDKNAFTGNIYLLVSPAVASAGSLFASMVAGNKNTIVIGEETMGGYYGHNGHTPLEYRLPGSKMITQFSIVNLEQDVPQKANQKFGRGIIPDHYITQTYDDYLKQNDTQLNFTIELISSMRR